MSKPTRDNHWGIVIFVLDGIETIAAWISRARALPIAHWPVPALSAGTTVQSPGARASRLTSRYPIQEKGSSLRANPAC